MKFTTSKIRNQLKKKLSEERFEHTLGVQYTAICLAMRYGYDIKRAELAGLLHDCARCIPDDKKLNMCDKYNIDITDVERKNPDLVHAKLGAFLAMHKYGVEDDKIISAIINHTTGRPNMTMLEKIIYVADYIEPNRYRAPKLRELRELAFIDIDKCLYEIIKITLDFLKHNDKEIDCITEKTYQYYEEDIKQHHQSKHKGEQK